MLQTIEFPRARQIEVEFPGHDMRADPDGTLMNTIMFRDGIYPEQSVPAVQDLQRKVGEICVFSVGCGDGSEVDTWLAYHKLSQDDRPVTVYGFDRKPELVDRAKSGLHFLPVDIYSKTELEDVQDVLDDFGFTADFETVIQLDGGPNQDGPGYYSIDANPVRAGHDVTFMQHDVRRTLPIDRDAHLITINNLLYHLSVTDADAVIDNCVASLAKGGILSFAGTSWNYMRGTQVWYEEWVEGVRNRLINKEGLLPFNLSRADAFRGYVRPH